MTAPALQPVPGVIGRGVSISNGIGGGARPHHYVSFLCGNVDEIEAFVRATLTESFGGDVIVTIDDGASTARYRVLRLTASPDASGLPGGPLHRQLLRRALDAAYDALRACYEASHGRGGS
jgi:hypothetical protein